MSEQANATRAFLGDEPQWRAARVELDDVQGLWGGRRIAVDGAGRLVVQVVEPGMWERRFELAVGADEWRRLVARLIENDFLTIEPAERAGIPDEARPRLTLTNAAGDRRSVSKWARVKDGRFDAVYAALRRLEDLTVHLEPVHRGRFEPGA